MNALIVLLGIISAALAVPAPFPHGKTLTYKYTADAKAGVNEPAPFASQFGIECQLHVKHDTSDPTLQNAYYVALTDVKHGLHNGRALHHEHLSIMQPIVDASKAIQTPFVIVYDENGHLQGIKLMDNEPGWSKNIKKSIASLLQLDLTNIYAESPMKPHSFITHEDTIHGTCQVAYNVHAKDQVDPTSGNMFVVTKIHEPENCTQFSHQVFNHVEAEDCHVEQEHSMTTASRRFFEIETRGMDMLIKKLIGHGVINYLPWMAKSEAHYLLTNQTLILENVAAAHEVQLPVVNFENVPITRNIAFEQSQTRYLSQADIDITHGRHFVELNELVFKLKKMLDEAAGYLKESHIERKQPDWKHGQTINRLLHVMGFMNVEPLEQIYSEIQNAQDSKQVSMKNIFLGLVPHVGTPAACLFTLNLIRTKRVPDTTAIVMLGDLPMHVKLPSKELLLQMEELLNLDDTTSAQVREASIFCFATLIHKTFKNEHAGVIDPLLDRYLQHFMEHIKNEPMYHMKMVYMMAMKNVRLSSVLKLLEPIIRGDMIISEKPHNIRFQAIWAIRHVVADLPHYAHDLLWPVLSDVSVPVAVRIAAYDVLMHQLPHVGRFMNIQWLMVSEKNEHLYNYHVDTIQGLANSVDPCLTPVREMARKVLAFTKKRHALGPLSSKIHVDYMDEKFGHGETVKGSWVIDQSTGVAYVGSFEHVAHTARKPVTQWGIHWNVNGLDQILKNVKQEVLGKAVEVITNDNVKNLLEKAAKDMPTLRDVHIDLILTMNNNVVFMFHSDKANWLKSLDELKQWKKFISKYMDNINWQTVMYHNHFEMHVPTDLGVPAVLATKMPSFNSLKMSTVLSEDKNLLGLKLKMKYQTWMHGEYVMSMYNPVADVWHAVRRTSSQDIVLPIEMNIGYNHDTKSLKLTLPRLPVSEYSISGISTSAKNFVTITDDETDLLKSTCGICRHHELITGVENPKTFEDTLDSKDTGLRMTMAVYDCESNLTPISPISEWMKVFTDEHKNTMGYKWVQFVMAFRQQMMNDMISGQGLSCTKLFKVEPSIVHPASMIDLTGKLSIQDLDHTHEKLGFLSSQRIDVRGTANVKAASTNESVRQWDMNMNIVLSQGHVNNSMKVMITRTTPQEKNLKICIEAQKDYQVDNSDLLNVDLGKKETNSKMTITMGQTKEDKCVRDELDVTMIVKGEMSEEQKEQIADDSFHGICAKQTQNPLFHSDSSSLPKTWDCIQQAILHSSLRKYTVNMALRKVPLNLVSNANIMQDILRTVFFQHIKYTWSHVEPGNAKIVLEFPYLTPVLDATVVTPTHSYELVQLPFGDSLWNMWMDNTHYDLPRLQKYVSGQAKACAIYPRVLLTMDNGTMPFIVPDKWTLLSGDHIDRTFSVFVKLVENNKLAVKVFVAENELEIVPTDTGAMVTLNNKVIDNYEKGVMVPENEPNFYAIRLTKAYGHLAIDSQVVPMYIYCSANSVGIILETVLQGHVTGMCGHMDGTHKFEIPKIYSTSHL